VEEEAVADVGIAGALQAAKAVVLEDVLGLVCSAGLETQ